MTLDPTFTYSGLVLFVTLVGGILTIIGFMRKTRRENEADTKALADSVKTHLGEQINRLEIGFEGRVAKLERDAVQFMARSEIEGKIEHERAGRLQVGELLQARTDRLSNDIRDLMVQVGAIKQRQDGTDQQMIELKQLVQGGFERAAVKLDRLADAVRGGSGGNREGTY